MISYAQNAEDVVLARLFRDRRAGRYVDVGAGHPTEDSVTRHFYDLGWRGINIEPMRREHEMLCRERTEDLNLCLALSDRTGQATLWEAPLENRGASTLSADVARSYAGKHFSPVTVEVTTLADIWRRHGNGPVDFLKIDAEGHEAAVIRGSDWANLQPRVLVVEATEPNRPVASHAEWEPLLLRAGYRVALFDGLNRFYAQGDDDEALRMLAAPANVFDRFEPWRLVRELQGAKEYIGALEQACSARDARIADLEMPRVTGATPAP